MGTGWLARSSEVALFKSLHHPVGKKGPDADEDFFVAAFLSGLKRDYLPLMKSFNPTSVLSGVLSSMLEMFRKLLLLSRNCLNPSTRCMGSLPRQINDLVSKGKDDKRIAAKKEEGKILKPYQKLSNEEQQYRREHGLCFKCGNK